MSLPIRTLPVLQHWDCHATGSCCFAYRITLSADEIQRIEQQQWSSADLDGLPPFTHTGPPWDRQVHLTKRGDGGCVFLSPQGRCRIHERFGFEAKPLPCRLYPFVLVPAGDHFRVSLRFACPSVAGSKGRALPEYSKELSQLADKLLVRENIQASSAGPLTRPPLLDDGTRLDWPDFLRIVDALIKLVRTGNDPMERRLRKCLFVAEQMRQNKLDSSIRSTRLGQVLDLLLQAAENETPVDVQLLPPPSWVGRILFRQAAALYTRKDMGPERGLAGRGRLALLIAAVRFARGTGRIPRLHAALPETTFEENEEPRGPLAAAAEEVLQRYYTIKVGSIQFCGAASFGLPLWEGLEGLVLTMPIVLWVARMFRQLPAEQAVQKALTVVDDHFGFNRVLGTQRQRLNVRILAGSGELARLIGWYSR